MLKFEVVGVVCNNVESYNGLALFKGTTGDALAAVANYCHNQNDIGVASFVFTTTGGSTTAITYTVRLGGNAAGAYLNGPTTTRKYGGAMASGITITEVWA